VATLEPRKGLDVLVRALVEPAAPDAAGRRWSGGWGSVDLETIATAAGLPVGRVRAVGRVDGPDLAALYDGASVLAVPSWAEGFGLRVLEGMLAGVPVVVSDDPALLETAGDAVTVVPRRNPLRWHGASPQRSAPTWRPVAAEPERSPGNERNERPR
jgi:glycosyltransferase involved in cell wall biosynthesis